MPLYEYRLKSGDCDTCGGCFVDLQKMSDAPHSACPDCGKACERVFAVPMVSVRGAEYRAKANAERRAESVARATGEQAKLRQESLKKSGQVPGHTHNCALVGCLKGSTVVDEVEPSVENEIEPQNGKKEARRFGGLPHLVGVGSKKG